MQLLYNELQKRGFKVEFIRPLVSSFQSISGLGYILGYAFTRDRLKDFDLVLGNGLGLLGAVDLPVKVIDNIHSTSSGSNRVFEKAIDILTEEEKDNLDRVLESLFGKTHLDIKDGLATKKDLFQIDKIVAQRADSIVTVSYGTCQEVKDFFEVGNKTIKVVPNGIEERWSARREYQSVVTDQAVNVVYSGRAGETVVNVFWKGIDRLLAVMSQVKGAQPLGIFHIGKSPEEPYAKLMTEAGITCLFNVDHTELPSYLRAGDIYIQTSRYEACSLSLMEAMASGLVPVTFPSGMVEHQIKDGENGFIVHSIQEMNERIQELIDDPEKRNAMGQIAAKTIREEYSVKKMVDGYVEAINALI